MIKSMIDHGMFTINGNIIKHANTTMKIGDIIGVNIIYKDILYKDVLYRTIKKIPF